MNKLALGTAQFGLKYGISNQIGKIQLKEVKEILQYAKSLNINIIDTAISYGDSEKVLGETGVKDFKFITKLPVFPKNIFDVSSWIENEIDLSLKRLNVQSLYGLLIHRSEDLIHGKSKDIVEALYKIKSKGKVKKIGISIYETSELEQLTDLIEIDIVQAPLNIFDQRLLTSGWLSKLHKNDIEIHVRSIFLQGLLLMPRQKYPSYFNQWQRLLKMWHEWLNDNKISALEATVRYALSINELSRVIVGITSKKQLKQIIIASDGELPPIPTELFSNDRNLLNPSNWTKA